MLQTYKALKTKRSLSGVILILFKKTFKNVGNQESDY